MVVGDVVKFLKRRFPEKLQESYDNSGAQYVSADINVKAVLVALDIDSDTVSYAKKIGANLILTHHPLIFKPLKSVTGQTYQERVLEDLIKSDISLYSLHTNLDRVYWDKPGITLGLENQCPLFPDEGTSTGFGAVGDLERMYSIQDLIVLCESRFGCNYIPYSGNPLQEVKRIAIMGGSGGSLIEDVLEVGVDLYITGDVKYHDAFAARASHLPVLDIGHFFSERVYLKFLVEEVQEYLTSTSEKIDIKEYTNEVTPLQLFRG